MRGHSIVYLVLSILLLQEANAGAGINNKEDSSIDSRGTKMTMSRIEKIFEATKPVCFSRFVIDVPENAAVVYGRMTINAEIERYPEMAKDVDNFIMHQIERDKDAGNIFDAGSEIDKMAGKPIGAGNDSVRHVLGITGDNRYSLNSFLVLGEDLFVFSEKGIIGKEVYKFMRDNENTASKLRIRLAGEVPEELGICIDGAFTTQEPEYENIQLGLRLGDFPDVHLSIYLLGNIDYAEPPEEFINRHNEALKRAREGGAEEWVKRLKFLRKGHRKIGDWIGDEILTRFPAWKNAKSGHQFAFSSPGKPKDRFHPQVDIKLDTGVKGNFTRSVPASITDDEAVALWDKLLNSIRVRPVKATAKNATLSFNAVAPVIPVGTQLSSDSICPASGWWQSFDSNAVEPARWFAKGDRFPLVHFRQDENWRSRLFDTPRIVLGSGMWQLMLHAEHGGPPAT
jgi:hypothetical protein